MPFNAVVQCQSSSHHEEQPSTLGTTLCQMSLPLLYYSSYRVYSTPAVSTLGQQQDHYLVLLPPQELCHARVKKTHLVQLYLQLMCPPRREQNPLPGPADVCLLPQTGDANLPSDWPDAWDLTSF